MFETDSQKKKDYYQYYVYICRKNDKANVEKC